MKPAHEWELTSEGELSASKLASTNVFGEIDAIYTSTERKAQQTAHPFTKNSGIDPYAHPGLDELYRGTNSSLSNEIYLRYVQDTLRNPPSPVQGWETPTDALRRFKEAIDEIETTQLSNVLVVSHGLVMTLYFANILNLDDYMYERWRRLRFLAWGQISQGNVVRDIVH